jgi:CheY-like chemotaxis protein
MTTQAPAVSSLPMTQPCALVVYEKLLPGSQLVNRLQDLNYRVQTLSDLGLLLRTAEEAKPMLVLIDLNSEGNVSEAISGLKSNSATSHLPIIAFGSEIPPGAEAKARAAGAKLVAGESAILGHLPQLLEQALEVE